MTGRIYPLAWYTMAVWAISSRGGGRGGLKCLLKPSEKESPPRSCRFNWTGCVEVWIQYLIITSLKTIKSWIVYVASCIWTATLHSCTFTGAIKKNYIWNTEDVRVRVTPLPKKCYESQYIRYTVFSFYPLLKTAVTTPLNSYNVLFFFLVK